MKHEVRAAQALSVGPVSVAYAEPSQITLYERFGAIRGDSLNKTASKLQVNAGAYRSDLFGRFGGIFWPESTFQVQLHQQLRLNAACRMHRKKNATIADRCHELLSLVFPSSRPLDAGITGSNPP